MISLLIILLVGFIALFSGGFKEKKRFPYGYYRDDYEPFDPCYNTPPRYHQPYYYDPYYPVQNGRSGRNSGEGCLMVVFIIIGLIGAVTYLSGG